MIQGLDNVRVLEVGSAVAGPYGTEILAAFGAEVIKIESPEGDSFRHAVMGSQEEEAEDEESISGYFAMMNCDKSSLCLDLKRETGIDIFHQLAKESDVIVENLRPGVMDRLGIGFDDIKEVNSNIVYCSVSAYGENNEWSNNPGFDPIIQAQTGVMSTNGEPGERPLKIGIAVIDLLTGMWAATSVLNALHYTKEVDEPVHIDTALYDVGISLLTKFATYYFNTGENPPRVGNQDVWTTPYGAFRTKDDEYVIISAQRPKHWTALCEAMGRPELAEDERFKDEAAKMENRDELLSLLQDEFDTKTKDEWLSLLNGKIPCGGIRSVPEALEADLTNVRGLVNHLEHETYGGIDVLNFPVQYGDEHHSFQSAPPMHGEHTRPILMDLGLSSAEIDELVKEGVISEYE